MLYKILDAFRARDADAAESLTRQYVGRSADYAQQVLHERAPGNPLKYR